MARGRTEAKGRSRLGGWGAAGLAVVALAATLFGGGRVGQAVESFDGSAWLWSRTAGEVDRVNPDSGKVEQRREVTDAKGHRVQVTQNDQHLLIHDLDTGRVSSLDLSGLGLSGRLNVGTKDDQHLVMGSSVAAIVGRTTGEVRALDPATLRPVGPVLRLPGPLVGGEFDSAGLLWVGVPGQGTVAALKVSAQGVAVSRTVEVAKPGADLVLSVLDQGALAVDRGGRDLVVATESGARRITAPVPLAGAMVPDRTHGALAVVTVPAAGALVTLGDVGKGGPVLSSPLRDPVQEPAVPFAGKVYIPVRETGQVRIQDPTGRQTGVLSMPEGRGDLVLQVRENNLFVNAPGSPNAQVVDAGGRVRMIGKYPVGPGRGGDRPGRTPPGDGPPLVEAPPVDPRFPDPVLPDLPPTRISPAPPRTEAPTPTPPGPERGTRPSTAPTTREPRPPSPGGGSAAPRPTTSKPRPGPTSSKPTSKPSSKPTSKPSSKPKPKPTSKPKPKPTKNPYTPQQVCNSGGSGGDYVVQRSSSFSGGRVYQLYSPSTKKNCAVTMKTANVGKGTSVWVRLEKQTGGADGYDSGTFKYYAGPVYVNASGICVRYSGGASGASASAGWGNCG
ncbi:hypothetical protein K8Z49_27465 [Actinomadura madurae]|uniref:Uncharacterized protein n=1 Tax=Actinomadura madurae TaxID=1993 RepID=A0A1I5YA39_9ACTN|nr:hypothetical protein [Actinomadura madurae]SFQ41065.1 hypothetical protein SAMN04489713_1313 [Actinomadura madurae]